MAYNLIITERCEELIDQSIIYVIDKLKNPDAAQHLLDEIDKVYARLESNPFQFNPSKDPGLRNRGYSEALICAMEYRIVFRIDGNIVFLVGFYHILENYVSKVIE
ncbi:MAG: type II toxin-antitoxin system RelE/ParE family toxin [Lachnospiraceae bacterium]|nr:type II toxin-antitoxin system RelE/ParE family toxin [Lachnospiraceae bacterium]